MLLTEKRAEGLNRLREEYDNLRVVLDRALDTDPVLAADIAVPLWRYWQMRGQLAEGRSVLDRLVDRLAPDDDPIAHAAALTARGGVAYWQLDVPAVTTSYEEAARLYEQVGDRAHLAEALYDLAFPVNQSGAFERAEGLARRSEELFAELGDAHGVARALWLRALTAIHQGRLEEAEDQLRRAAAAFRENADTYHLGWSLRMLGRDLLMQGRLEEARDVLDEGFDNVARDDISAVLLFMSDYSALAGLQGHPERQVRIVGAMQRMQRVTGTHRVDYAMNEPLGLEDSLAALGDRAEVVSAEGAAMDDDEAVRYALDR